MKHETELIQRMELATVWAQQAGELLLGMQGGVEGVQEKGVVDLVSDADRSAQALVLEGIKSSNRGDGYLFEEDACESSGESGFVWIVDPLDGTTNYLHGSRHYAVSIGVTYEGKRVGGVIYAPALDEMFVGYLGGGVTLNGQPVAVSTRAELEKSLLATGFPYNRRERVDMLLGELRWGLMLSRGIRRAGAAALDFAYVACGRIDGYWEHGLSPWDVCAGLFLVKEAGGRVSDVVGAEPTLRDSPLFASNGKIHDALLRGIMGNSENG